jgi:pimeloyl-ACP methyl ester carboxylesterase
MCEQPISPPESEGLGMSLGVKRSAAAIGRPLRKAIPARGWRRYVTGSLVIALAAFGSVEAVATPAHAARAGAAQTTASKDGVCVPPPSPQLAGFKQGWVSVPGDSLHYVIGGSGPVLVLIHGWPMTWWEWHTVMPSLAQTHTVIAFDLPGLGNSTVPTNFDYTTASTATLLHDAVTALGYSNVSILAHDLGVGIGYAYARLYPAQVGRLMVLESELNGYGLESIFGFSFHFGLNMQPSPTPEDIINNSEAEQAYLNYLYDFANKPGAVTTQDKDIWYGAYSCAANRESGYDYYRAMTADATWDTSTNTSLLTIPVVAMGGEDSFGTSVATSMELVDNSVSAVIAPDSGHYIPEEDPGFLTECANLFFGSTADPTAPAGYSGCLP